MITAEHLIQALEGSDFTVRDYSGRGMYGTHCVGIDVDTTGDVMKIAAMLTESGVEVDEIIELGERMTTDSMGRGMIIYWPSIKLTPAEVAALRAADDEDEDESEDE
jgi:hypothetical protein